MYLPSYGHGTTIFFCLPRNLYFTQGSDVMSSIAAHHAILLALFFWALQSSCQTSVLMETHCIINKNFWWFCLFSAISVNWAVTVRLCNGVRIATTTKSEQNWKRKVFSRALICSKKACIGFASGSSTTQGRLYSLLLSSQETKVELLHFMGGC